VVLLVPPPLFVTDIMTVITCPTLTWVTGIMNELIRFALGVIATLLLVAFRLCAGQPAFPSMPIAYPVKLMLPTPAPAV